MKKADKSIQIFQRKVWNFFYAYKRDFPWRETSDPYHILVSEIMLQQTQTSRVIEKYEAFLKVFPTIEALAGSSNQKVLQVWQGLGYNRRALYLKQTAEIATNKYDGILPNSLEELIKLPGIGKNTAGAILAFAFNTPVVFIETNIRRVYIHEFFKDKQNVDDKELLPLIKQTIDLNNPRLWYYALMDFGAHLPKQIPNPNRKSKHYTKQSKFEGSLRQIRGRILKLLLETPLTKQTLMKKLNDQRLESVLGELTKEGFIEYKNGKFHISS